MDHIGSCKEKLRVCRIKELKDILSQLGLPKQGKKQDLMDRILALLSDEQVSNTDGLARLVKIIDDAYRQMHVSGTSDLATKERVSDVSSMYPGVKVEAGFNLEKKFRCPCGIALPTEYIIQCADSRCQVWQHIGCVVIQEKVMECVSPASRQFYCEICRIERADPYWVTMEHRISPVKLTATNIPAGAVATTHLKSVEKTFQLTALDINVLRNSVYDLQAWCILLNDSVPFRMHWPLYADLRVNDIPVQAINRPASQLLGANGRDDGMLISSFVVLGTNKISLCGCDARVFCLGVRFVKPRTLNQVLSLIPKEIDGEPFEDALCRVRRCIGGGVAKEDEGSDDDLQVIADSVVVNLRCPISGSRMKTAGRFKHCTHMGCFDLKTLVELNQHSRKWQCPICLQNYCLEDIIIDPYFNHIITMISQCGDDITQIDVRPDGSWRAKKECELGKWHLPPGSFFDSKKEGTFRLEASKYIQQDYNSKGQPDLEPGTQESHSEVADVSKCDDMRSFFSSNQLEENFSNYGQKVITMDGRATGSAREDKDLSINQDVSGHLNMSANHGNETYTLDPTFDTEKSMSSTPLRDAGIIVLSDSEEDNALLFSPQTIHKTCALNDNEYRLSPPGFSGLYAKDPARDAGCCSLGIFDNDNNDFGLPQWSFPSSDQTDSLFDPFITYSDTPCSLIDVEPTSVAYSAPLDGYTVVPTSLPTDCGEQLFDSSVCHSKTDINNSLVSSPLAFVGEKDPSLRNFLPTQPVVPAQPALESQPSTANGLHNELGCDGSGSNCGDFHPGSAARDEMHLSKRARANGGSKILFRIWPNCNRTATVKMPILIKTAK